jgi:hypothetical protein
MPNGDWRDKPVDEERDKDIKEAAERREQGRPQGLLSSERRLVRENDR